MDDTTSQILRAFPTEYVDSDGERFFDVLLSRCRDSEVLTTVDKMVEAIVSHDSSFGPIAQRYAENLRATGLESAWADATTAMVNEGSGARLVLFCRTTTAATASTAATFTWAEFVAAQRDFWSTWGGPDWPAWREAFRQTGEQYGLAADVNAQLGWLDTLGTPDRAGYLRDTLGFTVHPAAFQPTPAVPDLAPEQVEAVLTETIDSIMTDVVAELPELAAELGVSVEQLQAELSQLPADAIADAIAQGLPG
jgi:hypothetical protein